MPNIFSRPGASSRYKQAHCDRRARFQVSSGLIWSHQSNLKSLSPPKAFLPYNVYTVQCCIQRDFEKQEQTIHRRYLSTNVCTLDLQLIYDYNG